MLDSSFNTKLGDFGLARLIDHEKGSYTTIVAGTMGYMAPECNKNRRASKESDMYSFGTVLLEITSGRRTLDKRLQEEELTLAEWVWSLYGLGKLVDAADSKFEAEFDEKEIERVMIVGLWCVHPDPNHRPSIKEANRVLNFETELPELPSDMPVPEYCPPRNRSYNNHYSHSSNVTTSSSSATALLSSSSGQDDDSGN